MDGFWLRKFCACGCAGVFSLVAAAEGTAPALRHYAVPAMSDEQRLPDVEPKDGERNGVVKIVAAKGEYEPGSFVVCAEESLGKVKLELGEFKQVKVKGEEEKTGVLFPKENLDLKFVKVWYQNRNAWFSYFGDTGFKLCPELLVNDEDLVRVDLERKANYARLIDADGKKVGERWINPPRRLDGGHVKCGNENTFQPMRPDFRDAKALQPVSFPKGVYKQFFLTAHVTKDIPAGLYKGEVRIGGEGEQGTDAHVVPVEIRVLDFELPGPKGYLKPEMDVLVASYDRLALENIMTFNGGDVELAERQFEAVMRNLAAHNQRLLMSSTADPFKRDYARQFAAMQRAGMCTKPCFAGAFDMYNLYNVSKVTQAERYTNAVQQLARFRREYGHGDVYVCWGDELSADVQRWMRPTYETYQRAGVKFCIAGNEQTYNPEGYAWDWFNIGAKPTDSDQLIPWLNTLDIPVAWYAQHHVGTENPAFQRRQNGMAAWLTGYTALCNYAHHLGPWNDDSTTYKPMVYIYGIFDGVVDTLAWEGFREGVDDMRYGTLLCQLAHAAQKRGDFTARKAGGKALQYLASFDRFGGDLNACRAEMVRHIEQLRDLLAQPAVAEPTVKVATCEERLDAVRALIAEAGADVSKRQKAVRRFAGVLGEFGRHDEAVAAYVAEGMWADALGYYRRGVFQFGHTGRCIEPEADRTNVLRLLKEPKCPRLVRSAAYIRLRKTDPDVADRYREDFFGADRKERLQAIKTLVGTVNGANSYYASGLGGVVTWAYRTAVAEAKRLGVALPVGTDQVKHLAFDFAAVGDYDGLRTVLDSVLETNTLKAASVYELRLSRGLLGESFGTPAMAEEAVRRLDGEWRGELSNKERVAALCNVGSAASVGGNENLVRGLEAVRKSLYKPQERKTYVVRFSPRPVVGVEDWAQVPSVKMDRAFGGSMEFLQTDVTTGDRGNVATGKARQQLAPPEMQVVADAAGLHFRFTIRDPKAREMDLKLVRGGSFEAYLAPGENTPYVCFLLRPGERAVRTLNTMYETDGNRMLRKDDLDLGRFDTVFYDDRFVCTLDLDWMLYATRLPKKGDLWDFEAIRWGAGGGQCWNGTESIHGRSTWGKLVFDFSESDWKAMVKRTVFRVYADYLREDTNLRYAGCLRKWTDPEVGDPEFHAAVIRPLMESIAPYGNLMKADMSDADLMTVYEKAYPTWADIRPIVGRLRAKYLNR